MKRFGAASLLLVTVFLTGCLYSLSGGGGLPRHVRTVAVIPFENETANPELTGELHQELRKALGGRLGLRDATEQRANAVVRGKITAYEADVPVAFSADPTRATSARRRLQLRVDVQIVDQTTGRVLFQRTGVSAEGEYAEREEAAGRKQAIQRIVNDIIEGAQSQW
ncbi:MAG TPA: LPS assembly lipoprotein LptE [Gemmatimonadaceae bacterium]|mgnify:FL=1|nr:LPS assembly lipoprotein LptE [Gemmatimonadaceae bacterium]